MTAEQWERANAQFLTDALAWLRERLEGYIKAMHGGRMPEAPATGSSSEKASPPSKTRTARAKKTSAQAAAPKSSSDHVPIDAKMSPPPGLGILGQRFALTPFELDVLLLCVGFELDTRIAGLCARAHDDPSRAYPTFALALTLFDDASWDVTSLERPLRRWQFVEVERRTTLPLALSPLRSDARTVDFVKGFNRLDERLATLMVPIGGPADAALPASQGGVVDRIVLALGDEKPREATTIQLVGPDADAKVQIARASSERLGRDVWMVKAPWLPSVAADVDEIARLWQREALLSMALLALDAEDVSDDRETDAARAARRLLSRLTTDALLMTRSAWPSKDEPSTVLEVQPPTLPEQLGAWKSVLGGKKEALALAPQLAAQFSLDIPAIERIAHLALSEKSETPAADRIWDECCIELRPRLDTLARRIDVKATWNDIVLPAEQDTQLTQIAAHVRGRYTVYEEWGFAQRMSRGLGISALFAGDSGTGKTMAAEVLANELRLPLYRIDLSAVVSKYIGETEKNLRTLFDAADAGGFILFFDEADALFGKRSEVRDSHDRYANIEVNYLLQRIEAYRGLAILATNAKAALDAAFVRRLRFIVNFPHPAVADRKRIWEKSFTAKTPVESLDLDRLARFNATGGIIHNASLGAAFAAATNGGVVTMPMLLTSLKAEYRKLNRPVNEAEFRDGDESKAPSVR
ncbi:MAG TPA: ATP-binding protein [Candidatus Cybelea sp.]|nr:ATP-binding protein [Candidatus Cybelea sp.]